MKQNNSKGRSILTACAVVAFAAGIYIGGQAMISQADGGLQPGSADDPLVTKQYLEERLAQLTGQPIPQPTTPNPSAPVTGDTNKAIQDAVTAEIAKLKQEVLASQQGSNSTSTGPSIGAATPPTSNDAVFAVTVIELKAGQALFAGAGTELVVRTGHAVAVSTDDNGIPDVTAGKDILAGEAIETNHLLLFPREGRGIKPNPDKDSDIFVMIRGPYMLMDENGKEIAS